MNMKIYTFFAIIIIALTAGCSQTATDTQHTLTIIKQGAGTVSSSPDGILCGTTCTAGFKQSLQVTLSATPDENSEFKGWSGDCVGTGPCALMMTKNLTATATFGPKKTALKFDATNKLADAPLGGEYSYSFCEPAISKKDPCDASATNPRGGTPPYHFELESGVGFPPLGLTLNQNGMLTGKPTAAGERKFSVCAVDLAGEQACRETSLTVTDPITGTWEGSYSAGVDVSEFCSNMPTLLHSGPIKLDLTQDKGKITGTGSIAGVNSISFSGTGTCTPQAMGGFDGTITGSLGAGDAVTLVIDFGDPDLFFPTLTFNGRITANEMTGTLEGEELKDGRATLNKQG